MALHDRVFSTRLSFDRWRVARAKRARLLLALAGWAVALPHAWAQAETPAHAAAASALDAELFYQLLLGELQWREGEPGAAFGLMLDAARKTGQEELFRRAIDIALQSRSGPAALAAAQEWSKADPQATEPQRFSLQILLALNRPAQALPALQALLQNSPPQQRDAIAKALPQLLGRVADKEGVLQLYQVLSSQMPGDPDLLYEYAMAAEKAGHLDETERLLRELIQRHPDYYHAYNALGYALADRNERLPEARGLIQQALQHAPNDPYILDSLGWVDFRLGRLQEAVRTLEQAYQLKPDAEIAAHLGEALWVQGQHDSARRIWREGLQLNADNPTLRATLQRLRVEP